MKVIVKMNSAEQLFLESSAKSIEELGKALVNDPNDFILFNTQDETVLLNKNFISSIVETV